MPERVKGKELYIVPEKEYQESYRTARHSLISLLIVTIAGILITVNISYLIMKNDSNGLLNPGLWAIILLILVIPELMIVSHIRESVTSRIKIYGNGFFSPHISILDIIHKRVMFIHFEDIQSIKFQDYARKCNVTLKNGKAIRLIAYAGYFEGYIRLCEILIPKFFKGKEKPDIKIMKKAYAAIMDSHMTKEKLLTILNAEAKANETFN